MQECDLNDVMKEIGEIKGTLKTHSEAVIKLLDKHDEKIGELEKFKNEAVGKQSVIASLSGAVFGVIGSTVWNMFVGK